MNRKNKVQSLIQQLADEIYDYIKEKEIDFKDGLVPTTEIKNEFKLLLMS